MIFKRSSIILIASLVGLIPASGRLTLTDNTVEENVVSQKGDSLVNTAMKYIGVRYRTGASGPKSFDCSGFTSYVYRQKNVSLTRSSRTQYNEGTPVKKISELRPGDLVFFGGSKSTRTVGHVGIVKELNADSSDFTFVHASRTGVKVDMLSSAYYKKRYIGARRVL